MATRVAPPSPVDAAWPRLRGPFVTAAVLGAGAWALHLRDPHQHGSWGLCPFKAVTGWNCPGCGGLRAVNDLGNGHVMAALHSNAMFVGSLPLLAVLWLLWVRRGWRPDARRLPPRVLTALGTAYVVLLLAFTVYRNTPWGASLRAS
jgi:hypothetical protein